MSTHTYMAVSTATLSSLQSKNSGSHSSIICVLKKLGAKFEVTSKIGGGDKTGEWV